MDDLSRLSDVGEAASLEDVREWFASLREEVEEEKGQTYAV